MPTIQDEEFGRITIRRSARATHVRVRVAPDGTLRASLPLYAPIFLVKRLLKSSRHELRAMLADAQPTESYVDGMRIGKSHSLLVRSAPGDKVKAERRKQLIIVSLPAGKSLNDSDVARIIRDGIISALRLEAMMRTGKATQ